MHDAASLFKRCTRCCLLFMQGVTSASHVERDEKAGLTYDFTMDFSIGLNGIYNVFCIPDDVNEEPYMLASIRDTPCYIHRWAGHYLPC